MVLPVGLVGWMGRVQRSEPRGFAGWLPREKDLFLISELKERRGRDWDDGMGWAGC